MHYLENMHYFGYNCRVNELKFLNKAEENHFKYKIDLAYIIDRKDWNDVVEWLDSNIGKYQWAVDRRDKMHRQISKRTTYYRFKSEKDALYFKMRWF